MADMDVAVGERRTIVQNKRAKRSRRLERLGIDMMLLPKLQRLRLALCEVSTLRNGGRIGIHSVWVLFVR
jgi:hypothetical protein